MQVRFAQTLSQLRHEKGVSQRQAAQALEVSQALLSHYENGIREPGLAFVVRACDYYQVSADYLLGRRVEREGGRAQGAPEGVDPAVLRSAAEVFRRMPEFRKWNLPSVTSNSAQQRSADSETREDFYSRSSAARSTTISWKSWPARAAVSAEADSRSTMVRSWPLREAESSMRWTQKQNCAIPMKTRISGRSTVISLESRCPIRRICCCIRSIGKIIKVSVKLRIQEKHADAKRLRAFPVSKALGCYAF